MLIFLPVAEENLSFRGGEAHPPPPPPTPPWSLGFRQRGLSASLDSQSDTEEHPRIRPTQHLGAVLISTGGGGVGGGVGGGKSEVSCIFCDCSASVSDGCLQEEQLGP